jgi:hypothetical protein
MKKDRTCEYCQTLFPQEEGRVFSNHVRWCKKNTTNGDKGVSAFLFACKKTVDERILTTKGTIEEFHVTCENCKKSFVIKEWSKLHPQKESYFCSRACANSRGSRTEDFKEKIRAKWEEKASRKIVVVTNCKSCGSTIVHKRKAIKTFCSRVCALRGRSQVESGSLKEYRGLCSFRFSLNDYPDEFDFGLVEKHGWYRAKNRGDNLNGVSRDHIVSVRYGYENGIDPKIISHPANCQLLRHNENVSKHKNCGLTIDELMMRISTWDDRYGGKGN